MTLLWDFPLKICEAVAEPINSTCTVSQKMLAYRRDNKAW